jgi:hypothetical protein
MSKWVEDTMYEITTSIKEKGIEKEFHKEYAKLDPKKWKWKPVVEKYEYVYYTILNANKEKGYENKHLDKKRRSNKR